MVRLSGLSRSTVDRVLNERPGVKTATVEKVETALRDLGYSPNALELRSANRPRQIEVLLPEGTNPFFEKIRLGMDHAAASDMRLGTRFLFRSFNPYDPSTIADLLKKVSPQTNAVITVGADEPNVSAQIGALADRGIRVVTIISDVPRSKRKAYVGQDNFSAGRTAGRIMGELVTSGPGNVAVLIGHLQFRHLLDRQSGFQNTLGTLRPELTIHQTRPYGTDPENARHIVKELFERVPDLKGLYLSGGGQPAIIQALRETAIPDCFIVGHEVNATTRVALQDGLFQVLVAHDVEEVGRKAIDVALGLDDRTEILCKINIFVSENLPPE